MDDFKTVTLDYLIRQVRERAASFGNKEGRYYAPSDVQIDEQVVRKLAALKGFFDDRFVLMPREPTEDILLALASAPKWSWSSLTIESATARYHAMTALAAGTDATRADEVPDLRTHLADVLRIVEAMKLSTGLGRKQIERVDRAKTALAAAGSAR